MVMATLLSAVCAFGFKWHRAAQRLDAAKAVWHGEKIDDPNGPCNDLIWEGSVRARRNLCLAECGMPFANQINSCRRYLDYISFIEPAVGRRGKYGGCHDWEKHSRYKEEAKSWLASGTLTPSDEIE